MSEIIINIISVVVTSILIPLITYFGIKLNNFLKSKIENEKLKTYIDNGTEAVTLAVASIMQTYVDDIKKRGEFNKAAQKEAFNKAKDKALTLITQESKNALETIYGDFNEWLKAQIESKVKELK